MAGAERRWTAPDGLALVATDYAPAEGPAKTPVICLHGLTRNSRDFDGLAPHIAAGGRRVLAADMRGRGRSAYDPYPFNYNPGIYAADVIALMAQSGIGRAVFVGTSMGGLITMTLASLRPDLVSGAVLNDVGPDLNLAGLSRIGAYLGQNPILATWAEAEAYAKLINGVAHPTFAEADWARMARRLFREEAPGKIRLDYDPQIAVPVRAAEPFAEAGEFLAEFDLWTQFSLLATGRPLLLVRGGRSDVLTAHAAARMAEAAPHMAQTTIPKTGHAPTLDEPAAVKAIDRLLAEADEDRAALALLPTATKLSAPRRHASSARASQATGSGRGTARPPCPWPPAGARPGS